MKVKLFSSETLMRRKGKQPLDLENEINDWLENNPSLQVIHIKHSACGGSGSSPKLYISVWYEEVN
jgi:hypothetical protein